MKKSIIFVSENKKEHIEKKYLYRCPNCGSFLGWSDNKTGGAVLKCNRCKEFVAANKTTVRREGRQPIP